MPCVILWEYAGERLVTPAKAPLSHLLPHFRQEEGFLETFDMLTV